MRSVLYFHGFASSPGSQKLLMLRERLEPRSYTFNAPDLNVPSFRNLDWEEMIELARSRLGPETSLIAGSSLGALLALDLCNRDRIDLPLVMIAPALGFGERWASLLPDDDPIPVFSYVTDREELIHRAFFDNPSLRSADESAPPGPVTIIAGTNDESVPFEGVRETWEGWLERDELAAGSKFIEIAGAGHSLVDFVDVIEAAIVLAASSVPESAGI